MTGRYRDYGDTRRSGQYVYSFKGAKAFVVVPDRRGNWVLHRGRVADPNKVERILNDQFRRLDGVFRRLK